MAKKHLHRITATLVFVYALVLYGTTISPSAALWDTGEFIASAHGLQVMHPPGAPFYMLLGRLFSMFVPALYVAVAVNLVSVLAASATVMLAYLVVVRLVQVWQTRGSDDSDLWSEVIAAAAGLVAALTLAASDSFWFNAVEAEVYAFATFFIAIAVWLALRWGAQAKEESGRGNAPFGMAANRYLVLIAYLFGLSVGIHLMSVLTYFFIALVVFFTLFDRPEWSSRERLVKLVTAGAVAATGFLIIYPGLVVGLPEVAASSGSAVTVLFGILAIVAAGIYYAHRKRRALLHLAFLSVAALLIGYSTYALIPIRSTANPPIDLNDPESAEALASYLKREQYGQAPLLKGPTYDDRTGQIDYQRPTLFPRRHSPDPGHLTVYGRYESDWDYFVRYQLGHMYVRYFLWNFAGRAHDQQHAGWDAGFSDVEKAPYVYETPSERASRNTYFGLPLLLGLFGLLYHFRRDWRHALALLSLFLVAGVGLIVYLNEIPITPRERDYIYVGSFFAYALWVGLGAAGILEGLAHLAQRRAGFWPRLATAGVVGTVLLAVPGRMVQQNYDDHDRSGNYVARDFAYNLLMSLEEDAVLFTRGDNDTYPLWYLQDVEGVRRDVRVVCLALLMSDWYAKQIRDQWAYEAAPPPISLSDAQIEQLEPVRWEPREMQLPVDVAALRMQTEMQMEEEDVRGFVNPMTWRLTGRPYSRDLNVLYPSDMVVLNILMENARQGWTRPIYFAATTAPDDQLDLQPYLQREGLAYRVVPIRHDEPGGRIVSRIMADRLAHFRYTNLDNPNVYVADDARSLAGFHYRLVHNQAADTLIEEGRPEAARQVMDTIMDEVPADTIPLHPFQALSMARTYLSLGVEERAADLMRSAEPRVLNQFRTAGTRSEAEQAARLAQAVQLVYVQSRAFEEAAEMSGRLADLGGDESLRRTPQYFEDLYRHVAPPSL